MTPIRSKERFLVFGSPRIEDDEIAEVVQSLRTAWLGTGPKVAQLEKDFRAYVGTGHAVALNSCTAALHLSMLACELQPGDEVITTAMTFCASVNAIIHAGLKPVIVDVDRRTMNIDPARIEAAITPRTRAILPVHFAGRPCEMDAILDVARRHKLRIVEDCAHAIETTYHGKHAGTFGEFGCFSFYVTKNVTTGEGGLVLTRDEEHASRIKVLGLHGMSKDAWKRFSDDGYKHYQVVTAGFKYNMPDLAAAIGIHQLRKVDAYWLRRQEIWQRYNAAFADLPLETPADPAPDTRHAYHLYTILIDEAAGGVTRDEVLTRMTRHNVGVGVHYQSIPEHPFYQETFGWLPKHYPNAAEIGRRTISIPISAKLTDDDVADVIAAVRSSLNR